VEEEKKWGATLKKKQEEEAKKKSTPVDVSSVFGFTSTQSTKKEVPVEELEEPPLPPPATPFFSDSFEQEDDLGESTPPPPPSTPFFSDVDDDYDDDFTAEEDTKETDFTPQSLGSMDEQKFRKIATGARVQTADEEAALKKKWEEFQEAEKRMRDATGLSESGDGTVTPETAKLKIDLSEVTLADGDVDAEKVLASLGPRPTKKPKEGGATTTTTPPSSEKKNLAAAFQPPNPPPLSEFFSGKPQEDSYQQFIEYEEQSRLQKSMEDEKQEPTNEVENITGEQDESEEEEEEDIIIHQGHATKLDPSDVSEQLYRPIAATAGDALKDNADAKAMDKAAFEEYLRKEEEMRKKIDSQQIVGKDDVANDMSKMDINDEGSVDDLLSKLGSRPAVPKRKASAGSFLGMDDDEDEDDLSSGKRTKKRQRKPSSSIYEQMPDWLRRDQAERRREEFETDEYYDDDDEDYDDDDDIIDYAERERQAAEFERSRSAKKEVNIADVFGRDYFGPDDFGDDYSMTKGADDSFSSFDTRKETLLEYEQLSVWELNNLMDHKSDMDTASKYLKRINKPYREFGGIFRLEGCLVDLTGLHWQAWKKAAEAFEFDRPSLNDVKLASLVRAETAVQRIFYWTEDIFLAREIAQAQRDALKECFDQWMEEEKITLPDNNGTSLVTGGGGDEQETSSGDGNTLRVEPTEAEVFAMQAEAWGKAASMYGFGLPTLENMQVASLLSPEEAISKVFNWPADKIQLAGMVSTYRGAMKKATDAWLKEHNEASSSQRKDKSVDESLSSDRRNQTPSNEVVIDENVMLEIQVFAWAKAAEKYSFDSPLLEEVQLASWVSPEEAVKNVFKWTNDAGTIKEIATAHRDGMREISAKYIKKFNLEQKVEPEVAETPTASVTPNVPVAPERSREQAEKVAPKPSSPTDADIMRIQFESWVKVASDNGFNSPTVDEAQLATFVSPQDAVQRVFKWSNDETECQKIALAHREALKEASRKLMENFNADALSLNDSKTTDNAQGEDDLPLFSLEGDAPEWLEAMEDVEMPCAVMSNLERYQLDVILEQTGLSSFFPPERRVSSSNGYENESQDMLGGALRVERRPDHCIVFDTTPSAAVAAHDVDMKIVTMIGYYPKYELITSDQTARYFGDLNTVYLRNLFSERVYDEPMVDLQPVAPEIKRAPKTRFWEEGDRG